MRILLVCLLLATGCDYVIPVRAVRTLKNEPKAFTNRATWEEYVPPSVVFVDPEYKTISSGRTFYRYDRIWITDDFIMFTNSNTGLVTKIVSSQHKIVEGE